MTKASADIYKKANTVTNKITVVDQCLNIFD